MQQIRLSYLQHKTGDKYMQYSEDRNNVETSQSTKQNMCKPAKHILRKYT